MTADQYTELIDFLGVRFTRIDTRFDALEKRMDGLEKRMDGLEDRLVKVEVGLEGLRHEVQLVAEGVSAVSQRLDRHHRDHEIRITALETYLFEN